MVENFEAFLELLLAAPYVKGFVMLFFFLVGIITAIVPESLVHIIPQLKGHYYKRIAFGIGLASSIILVGVVASWFLGPTFLGWWGYLLGAIALVIGALQAFELLAFIHPPVHMKAKPRRVEVRNQFEDDDLLDHLRENTSENEMATKLEKIGTSRLRKNNVAKLIRLTINGVRTGVFWGNDRFAIYLWLVVSIAMVGWRMAALMIISFIVGNIFMTVWVGRRYERIAKIATRPYYRKLLLIFMHFMGFLMLGEAIYLLKTIV